MSLNKKYGWPTACTAAGCAAEYCFYCESPLSLRHEHDHFPLPARVGATEVVAACVNCHDLKDRVLFLDWPPSTLVPAIQDLQLTLCCPPPLQYASDGEKCLGALLAAVDRNPELYRSTAWKRLSAPGRLLYAKLRFLQADAERRATVALARGVNETPRCS